MIETNTAQWESRAAAGLRARQAAGSSTSPSRTAELRQAKLNPDVMSPPRRERVGIDEDPERWDGLS